MKLLRVAALGVALIVAGAVSAHAQGGMGGGGGRPGRGNMLAGIDSTLSADQKAKVAEIQAKYAPERQAIGDMMATDREGAMKKRMELFAKINPELRAILSASQQVVFDKNVEDMAKRMAAPRPAPPAQ